MMDINNLMKDVRDAVEVALKGRVYECETTDIRVVDDVVAKMRVLVAPVIDEVNSQNGDIDMYQDEIEELREKVGELEVEVKERDEEVKRQEIIKIFEGVVI